MRETRLSRTFDERVGFRPPKAGTVLLESAEVADLDSTAPVRKERNHQKCGRPKIEPEFTNGTDGLKRMGVERLRPVTNHNGGPTAMGFPRARAKFGHRRRSNAFVHSERGRGRTSQSVVFWGYPGRGEIPGGSGGGKPEKRWHWGYGNAKGGQRIGGRPLQKGVVWFSAFSDTAKRGRFREKWSQEPPPAFPPPRWHKLRPARRARGCARLSQSGKAAAPLPNPHRNPGIWPGQSNPAHFLPLPATQIWQNDPPLEGLSHGAWDPR